MTCGAVEATLTGGAWDAADATTGVLAGALGGAPALFGWDDD